MTDEAAIRAQLLLHAVTQQRDASATNAAELAVEVQILRHRLDAALKRLAALTPEPTGER